MNSIFDKEGVVEFGVVGTMGAIAGVVDEGVSTAPLGNTLNESSLPRVASKPPVLRPGVKMIVIGSVV